MTDTTPTITLTLSEEQYKAIKRAITVYSTMTLGQTSSEMCTAKQVADKLNHTNSTTIKLID